MVSQFVEKAILVSGLAGQHSPASRQVLDVLKRHVTKEDLEEQYSAILRSIEASFFLA